jgi:hypothetical protein
METDLSIIIPKRNKTKKKKTIFNILPNTSSSKSNKSKSDTINPCDKENELRIERKNLNERLKEYHNKCEQTKYKTIYKYFTNNKSTYKDLLNALMMYYKESKENDPAFILPFVKFLDMFERDTMNYNNFKKQHVFEAICKILLMYDYDNGKLGRNKQFYNSLEEFVKNPTKPSNIVTRNEIINEKINVSSKNGVVDIFFKTEHSNLFEDKCEWMCDCVEKNNTEEGVTSNQEYILIQNKYYSEEKSNLDKYDVTKIFTNASFLDEAHIKRKIILMVNDSQALNDKLTRSKNDINSIISQIYGVKEIDDWLNLLLYELLISKDIDDYLHKKNTKDITKPELNARFHQLYFTKSTIEYYNQGYKKFIWGAVPRSGKSYMIGDLISKRKYFVFNDIVLILGAKTETESQFIKMFCGFADYNNYGIIKTSVGKMDAIKNCNNLNVKKDKNIYIFSQDFFKNKLENDEFKRNFITSYSHLFKRGNVIDIYFDEVHKGGSTDKSENILNAINNAGVKIDIFVMVTATFAKPNIKYKTNFIDEKEAKIIEWSYEDQQNMKHVNNETKMDMMINTRTGIEKTIMAEIFKYYKEMYNNDFLQIISKEYQSHPELVLVQPFKIMNEFTGAENYNDFAIDKVFKSNLKCEACFQKQTLNDLRNPSHIFYDYGRIKQLFDLIIGTNGNMSANTSIYGYLKSINAPDYAEKHSEIWFLPDDDLYITPDECRKNCYKEKNNKEETHNDDKEKKTNLPNIEPLTRGLAFALMNNEFFQKYYNVLIVHNTPIEFKNPVNGEKIHYDKLFHNTGIMTTFNSKNLSETIQEYETHTYREGKNLIILTGAKLRLGISLPCVDIGFNFDNIQSVDLNYQTMFRVLTERNNKPKNYGYYVDFNKERTIQFMYQYNNTYSRSKNISNIKENISNLQGLLILFNMNGLGIKNLNAQNELKLYNSLINELKLNEVGYKSYYSSFQNISNLFKKNLINVSITDLQKFTPLIETTYMKNKKKDIKKLLKEGKKIRPVVEKTEEDLPDDGEEEEAKIDDEVEAEKDEPNSKLIDNISEILPRIIALIALFSNQDNYNCDNLLQCLDNCLRKIERFGTACNCSIIEESDILACYFKTPFYNEKLTDLVKTIKEVIQNNNQLLNTTNFIFNNIREAMGRETEPLIYKMTPKDIQTKIEEYLPIRKEKKDKNGEVFTPMELIEEMLDKLPASVWKNPELKWLDPANGIGNFPMVVYNRLLDHLPDTYEGSYSTVNGKKKHIIEKMLYMIEIDPANIKISKKIFGSNANISCANFLQQENKWKHDFGGISEFDIIMGNPPFNIEKDAEKQGGYGSRILWDKFIIKSFQLLVKNGYLCFINPPAWRKPENELYKLMTKYNQLIYLHIFNKKKGQELFGVSQRFDLYIIQKKPAYKNTEIIDELNNKIDLDISKWMFIPNYEFKAIKQIMTQNNGIDVIYSASFYHNTKPYLKTKQTEKYKYPVVNSITKDGLVFFYSSEDKGHFGVPKVLLNLNEKQYPVNDYEGKYGMSNITFGIPISSKKEGDEIINAINSDKFREIIKATKWGAFQTDWRMFKYFKKDFYKSFLNHQHSETKRRTAAEKIKHFITRKHKEKSKKSSNKSGGKRHTRKYNKKTRKSVFKFW